jgi:hypothetical protein
MNFVLTMSSLTAVFHAFGDHRLLGDEEEGAGRGDSAAVDRNQSAEDRHIVSGLRCIWLR